MSNIVCLPTKTIKNQPKDSAQCPQCKHNLFFVSYENGKIVLVCGNCNTVSALE